MRITAMWHSIGSVAYKEFLHIYRDRRILALILILPPFFTLLFGHAFEGKALSPGPFHDLTSRRPGAGDLRHRHGRVRDISRLYRADNVLIQVVGDTGVGLSIAKTLTEAQKGRIWVESQMGVGSTFSVLLPLARKPAEN